MHMYATLSCDKAIGRGTTRAANNLIHNTYLGGNPAHEHLEHLQIFQVGKSLLPHCGQSPLLEVLAMVGLGFTSQFLGVCDPQLQAILKSPIVDR